MHDLTIHHTSHKPTTVWKFVDRGTFTDLTNSRHGATLLDFKDLGHPKGKIATKLALANQHYLYILNTLVNYTVFGEGDRPEFPVTESQFKYLESQAKDFLNTPKESGAPFYEILPIDDVCFLVIMEDGFLNLLTQSKDTVCAFVLACLGNIDRFKGDASQLNRQYLRLLFIENYHLLIKARAQS